MQRPLKGLKKPSEASYWHLQEKPFHTGLQKVSGWVDGLIRAVRIASSLLITFFTPKPKRCQGQN
jgi:hypothetical protein